jgi:hypothetical protein
MMSMRIRGSLLLVTATCAWSLCAACDLEPPPKQQPVAAAPTHVVAPTPTPPPVVAAVPPPPTAMGAGSGSGSGSAADPVTYDCITVADHLVGLSLAAIAKPRERAIQTRNRAKLVRQSAEACTTGAWTPAVIRCFMDATTPAELAACSKLLPDAAPPPPKPLKQPKHH